MFLLVLAAVLLAAEDSRAASLAMAQSNQQANARKLDVLRWRLEGQVHIVEQIMAAFDRGGESTLLELADGSGASNNLWKAPSPSKIRSALSMLKRSMEVNLDTMDRFRFEPDDNDDLFLAAVSVAAGVEDGVFPDGV